MPSPASLTHVPSNLSPSLLSVPPFLHMSLLLALYLNIWLFMNQLLSKQHLPDGLIRIEVFALCVCYTRTPKHTHTHTHMSFFFFYYFCSICKPDQSVFTSTLFLSFLAPHRYPTAAVSRHGSLLKETVCVPRMNQLGPSSPHL